MIALALRQATHNAPNEAAVKKGIPIWNDSPVRELVQDARSPVFIATPYKDSLDEIAEDTFRGSYAEIAALGFAIASRLDGNAPDLKIKIKDQQQLAEKIANSLKNAKNPLIISGINCGDEAIVHAALNTATALLSAGSKVMLSMVLPECNTMGLALIPGKPLEDALLSATDEEIGTVIILENDLYRRADEEAVSRFFNRCRQIIMLDHLMNNTSLSADILIPSATFAESEGTIVNNEGRAQRYYKTIVNKDQVKESWRWISDFIKIKDENRTATWNRFDDVVSSLLIELPVFSKLKKYMPDADFRMLNEKIPRQTIRYSGRTAMNANIAVSETKIPQDDNSSLAFSMEGQPEKPPSSLVPFYWTPGWNSVHALYNYLDEPGGSMKGGDPGIRLIEQGERGNISYFKTGPQTFQAQKDEWLIIPVYQIFGSDELSSVGPSIAQRIQEPFVYLNQEDAEIINVNEGDLVQLEISATRFKIRVRIENSLQQGIAGLSVNLPGMPFIELPGYGKFNKR